MHWAAACDSACADARLRGARLLASGRCEAGELARSAERGAERAAGRAWFMGVTHFCSRGAAGPSAKC